MSYQTVHSAQVALSENKSRELKVSGNKIVYANEETVEVILRGVTITSANMNFYPAALEQANVLGSAIYAMDNLGCNLIRLHVHTDGWYGNVPYVLDGGDGYRNYIDSVIDQASERGKYVILNLQGSGQFSDQKYIDFWDDAAVRYKNNPTVLFGLLNEPSGTWDTWLNGDTDEGSVNGQQSVGHQFMVERIRNSGAKNILIVSGQGFATNLEEIMNGYALTDRNLNGDPEISGNGIVYNIHIEIANNHNNLPPVAPWITGKNRGVNEVRVEHPVIIGQFSWQPHTGWIIGMGPGHASRWFPDFFAWADDYETYGNRLSWAANSFSPDLPNMIIPDKESGVNWKIEYPLTQFGEYIAEELNRLNNPPPQPCDICGDIDCEGDCVPPITTTATAVRINEKIVLTVTTDIPVTKQFLHIAVYNNLDGLVDYITIPILEGELLDRFYTVFRAVDGADYAKVFVWDSPETMTPLGGVSKVDIVDLGL